MPAKSQVLKRDKGVEILVEHHFDAPPQQVFDFFSRHENLSHVFGGKIERSQAAPEGEDPNGLGSVRRIKLGPGPAFEERIERYEPPQCIEYTITGGSPVKDHYGRMQFSAEGDGTLMRYSIRLTGRIPGTSGLIGKVMADGLSKGLPRAERLLKSA